MWPLSLIGLLLVVLASGGGAEPSLHRVALNQYLEGNHPAALETVKKAIADGVPDGGPGGADSSLSLWHIAGLCLYQQGSMAASSAAFYRAATLHPNHEAHWTNLGDSLVVQFRLDEAASAFERAIAVKLKETGASADGIAVAEAQLRDVDVVKLWKARTWMAHWGDWQLLRSQLSDRSRRDAMALMLLGLPRALSGGMVEANGTAGGTLVPIGLHNRLPGSLFAASGGRSRLRLRLFGRRLTATSWANPANRRLAVSVANRHRSTASDFLGAPVALAVPLARAMLWNNVPAAESTASVLQGSGPLAAPVVGGAPPLSQRSLYSDHTANMSGSSEAPPAEVQAAQSLLRFSRAAAAKLVAPSAQSALVTADSEPVPRHSPAFHVGIVTSDLGVHPVASLLRGFVRHLAGARLHLRGAVMGAEATGDAAGKGVDDALVEGRVKVTIFSLSNKPLSWWGRNISAEADASVDLAGLSAEAAASAIRAAGPHAVLDLNGFTLGNGLHALSFRPAPVQATFLGFAGTSGASFLDHTFGDRVATPVESAGRQLSEGLLLGRRPFFVTDYRATQSHVLSLPRASRQELRLEPCGSACSEARRIASVQHEQLMEHSSLSLQVHSGSLSQQREAIGTSPGRPLQASPLLAATFANYQKISPEDWTVWMALLRANPAMELWILRHEAFPSAEPRLQREAAAHGVWPGRLRFSNKTAWIDHIRSKSAADLLLDTSQKNGHTTVADALWAGVPVVTLLGDRWTNRVAASLVGGTRSHPGGYSAASGLSRGQKSPAAASPTTAATRKQYEVVARYLSGTSAGRGALQALRRRVQAARTSRAGDPLFDTGAAADEVKRLLLAAAGARAAQLDQQVLRATGDLPAWAAGLATGVAPWEMVTPQHIVISRSQAQS